MYASMTVCSKNIYDKNDSPTEYAGFDQSG